MKKVYFLLIGLALAQPQWLNASGSDKMPENILWIKKKLEKTQKINLRQNQLPVSLLPEVTKQKMDSVVYKMLLNNTWFIDSKQIFTYNQYGKTLSEEYLDTDWINEEEFELGPLEPEFRLEYQYDENNRLAVLLEYERPYLDEEETIQGPIQLDEKTEFFYDNSGRLSHEIDYDFDSTSQTFLIDDKEEYAYNTAGKVISETDYTWNSALSSWDNSFLTEYDYYPDGKLSSETESNWDETNSQWQNSWRETYQYNTSGKISVENDYFYNQGTQEWGLSGTDSSFYDEQGRLTLSIEYYYTGETVEPSWKSEFVHNGQTLSESYYYWENGQWAMEYHGEIRLNLSVSIHDLIFPNEEWLDLMYMEFQPVFAVGYDDENTEQISDSSYIYYSPITIQSVVPETPIASDHLQAFPNPTKGELNFSAEWASGANFELFNLNGQLVFSLPLDSKGKIQLNQVLPGMYFYRLSNQNHSATGKLSVK